jgi:hypothetical protein
MGIAWRCVGIVGGQFGALTLDLRPGQPLIRAVGIAATREGPAVPLLQGVDPVTFLTAGTRAAPSGRPPSMSIWNGFFDNPARRPYQTYRSRLDLRRVSVSSHGRRATLALGDLTIGPFSGEMCFTVYAGSRLLHQEAVVTTQEGRRAILYDAGLINVAASWRRMSWIDTDGHWQHSAVDPSQADRPLVVRHRTIIAESDQGSVACFPPPHQSQFPRDSTENYRFVWIGRNHQGFAQPFGFGVRRDPSGGSGFVPWFNAPPGTRQHLGVFYLLTRGPAGEALRETLRYTYGDRFAALPGYITFTSHWHMAVAATAMDQRPRAGARPPAVGGKGASPLPVPDFVRVFKEMGVNAVHLAEFHGDGHPNDPGPLRLPELETLFAECRRLSDARFSVPLAWSGIRY